MLFWEICCEGSLKKKSTDPCLDCCTGPGCSLLKWTWKIDRGGCKGANINKLQKGNRDQFR